jgi:endonuclease/exonuclease/phosphatase family metal-dependent hydrolase
MRALDFDTPTADVGATQHVAGLEFRLDAVYTRALTVGTPHVARDVDVSDHWPLWIDVAVPSAP